MYSHLAKHIYKAKGNQYMLGLESAMDDRVSYGKETAKKSDSSERLLGKYGSGAGGSTLIITADAWENENRAVAAIRKVLRTLTKFKIPIKGQLVGLAGNTGSSKKDLLGEFKGSFSNDNGPNSQDEYLGYNRSEEFVELIEEFERIPGSDVYYLDLKTSSSVHSPYLCHSRNPGCVTFASSFPFYKVMGLDKYITDHLGFYLHAKNYTCSTLKVGMHPKYSAEQIHEAAVWWALVQIGCLQDEDVPHFLQHKEVLDGCLADEGKRAFEVAFKYSIKEDEYFRMIPGYKNFQKIQAGDVLATSDGACVTSHWDGRIFMPLYHTQSNDGFFVLKEIE
jgi:succinylglutamate desuccinylase